MFLFWIFLSIIFALTVWLIFWSFITFMVERSKYQKQFSAGKIPDLAPDGFYQGAAHLLFDKNVPWLGKSFECEKNSGFNIFTQTGAKLLKMMTPFYKLFAADTDGHTHAYYFKTFAGKGLKDKNLQVIKLDYNSTENPLLIQVILDEIVEIAPEEFLGKVHLKVFPRFYATIGYFGLKKH
ncbi:hypothetical protein BH10ACI1_BH10ACI1_35230 [soil metagenome]